MLAPDPLVRDTVLVSPHMVSQNSCVETAVPFPSAGNFLIRARPGTNRALNDKYCRTNRFEVIWRICSHSHYLFTSTIRLTEGLDQKRGESRWYSRSSPRRKSSRSTTYRVHQSMYISVGTPALIRAKFRALTPRSADFLGSHNDGLPNPIVGSWFRIEQGPPATPPKYEYDEVGVVIEGW